jgi:hypothetical protein
MQIIKYILFTIFFLILPHKQSLAHSNIKYQELFAKADKLFEEKKYSESYTLYFDLFKKHNIYSPQSLLKMSFIKEAWGDNVEAVYFLNFFYEKYPEKKVFNKMKELADKEKFEGYQYSDFEFFTNLYRNYHDEVLFSIMGLMFIYFLAVITNKIFIKGISNSSPIFYIIITVFVFFMLNFGEKYVNPPKAVVVKDKAIVMNGPSAGAKNVGTIPKGNRVIIRDEIDIWAKIKMGDSLYFIRKSNLSI